MTFTRADAINSRYVLCRQSTNHVLVRGEKLDPILWQGKQWAVTTYGLECRDGTYHVKAGKHFSEFGEAYWSKNQYDRESIFVGWFKHLSGKSWVDHDDVDSALQAMLVLFDKDGNRTNVSAPALIDEYSIEEFALQAGEQAYAAAKLKALEGRV